MRLTEVHGRFPFAHRHAVFHKQIDKPGCAMWIARRDGHENDLKPAFHSFFETAFKGLVFVVIALRRVSPTKKAM